MDPAPARSVEFAEKHALPGPQQQLAFLNDQGFGSGHQAGEDVRRRIAFAMPEIVLAGKTAFKKFADIMPDVRIGVLVDGHSGRERNMSNWVRKQEFEQLILYCDIERFPLFYAYENQLFIRFYINRIYLIASNYELGFIFGQR